MTILRSLFYAAIFYAGTAVLAIAGLLAGIVGRRPMLAVILAWTDFNRWLARNLLGIHVRVEGTVPDGAFLVAAKHQSLFETTEMVRIAHMPVIVMKRELARIPFFGWLTRRYGIIAVERSAGAKALRALVEEGRRAKADGRSVIIYPEGTRVRPGEAPPLKPGFAALYRALGLPVVPVALNSGVLWGRGIAKKSGVITFRVGETIPAGLSRREIEERTHAAINALESGAQASA